MGSGKIDLYLQKLKTKIFIAFWTNVFFFNCCLIATAQNQDDIDLTKLVHIGMESGLSSNRVKCIFQDKKGFIWMGTDYGLNRYDGYNFKIFTGNVHDSVSLSDNDINCITQDANGNIWIGTHRGLNVMDYETGKIIPFAAKKNKTDSVWKYNITALAADDSSVWIGTAGKGLLQYNIFKEDLKKYVKAINDTDTLGRGAVINHLIVGNNGNILGGMNHSNFLGLIEVNVKTGILQRIFLERKLEEKKKNYIKYSGNDMIRSIYKDSKGIIYIGTDKGSFLGASRKCDSCEESFHEEIFEGKSFFRNIADTGFREIEVPDPGKETNGLLDGTLFVEYKPGKILFCNRNACGVFDLLKSKPQSLNAKTISYPKGMEIEQVFKDKSGKLWFITSSGIETLEPIKLLSKITKLKGIYPNSVVEDNDNKIWLGSDTSLIVFDKTDVKPDIYKPQKFNEYGFSSIGTFEKSNMIFGICDFDVYGFDKNLKYFRKIADLHSNDPAASHNFGWYDLYCTSDGSLWVRTNRGIGKVQIQTGKVTYVVPEDTINRGSSSSDNPYLDDEHQNFYLCDTRQIIEVNYQANSYKVFNIEKSGLTDTRITSVTKDHAGNLWLASNNQGLTAFNLQSQKLYRFTVKNGLPTNKTSRILFVNGAIWVNHQNGIYKFVPPENPDDPAQKPVIKTYGVKDGLPGINFSASAMIRCRDGKILFVADTTLISFYPDSIKSNEYIPPVALTSLQVNNNYIEAGDSGKILFKNISSTDTIHLNHLQNTLSFEYAALNYIHADENEYAYKLEGMDTSWIYCAKRRFITYSNLPPGEYTFHVKGSNNDGIWNEAGAQLKIFISPPYWQTAWFKIISALCILFIVTGIFKWRTRKLRADKRKLEQKVEDRTRELKQSQQQIIHQEKMASLGQLTAGVAHEINNPINFISASISPLKRNYGELVDFITRKKEMSANDLNYTINESKQLLKGIEEGSRRTAEIVKGLRNFSRFDEGEKKKVNINEGIESTLLLINNLLNKKKIEVVKSFGELPQIECYPGPLNQVFMNVLTNAIDAISENGKITITTSKENDKLKISIVDTGKGMSTEVKQKIFDPFYTTKDVGKGTGLGLSISYGIIEKHKGNIEVISEVGKGSEFIIWLPVVS